MSSCFSSLLHSANFWSTEFYKWSISGPIKPFLSRFSRDYYISTVKVAAPLASFLYSLEPTLLPTSKSSLTAYSIIKFSSFASICVRATLFVLLSFSILLAPRFLPPVYCRPSNAFYLRFTKSCISGLATMCVYLL